MIKREIRKILKQVDENWNKQCSNRCSKCKYHLNGISCYCVYLLCWLAEQDEIIKMIKKSENEK